MLGKHFKIRNMENMNVYRHYTICNAMAPATYKNYLKALKSGDANNFDKSLLSCENRDFLMLTIKNYREPTGLSFRFF